MESFLKMIDAGTAEKAKRKRETRRPEKYVFRSNKGKHDPLYSSFKRSLAINSYSLTEEKLLI